MGNAGQPLRCAQGPCHSANRQHTGGVVTKAPGFARGGDSPARPLGWHHAQMAANKQGQQRDLQPPAADVPLGL